MDHVFHVYVLWPLLSGLSASPDEKRATVCWSHYLVIFSSLVHTQPEKSVKVILCFWQIVSFWRIDLGFFVWPTLFSCSCNSSLVSARGHYSTHHASVLKVPFVLLCDWLLLLLFFLRWVLIFIRWRPRRSFQFTYRHSDSFFCCMVD